MTTKLPGLKNIPPKTDRELKIALDAIKEALEVRLGRRGDPLDRAVTLRELSDSGIVKVRNKAVGVENGISPPDDGGPGDLTTPPAPTNLEASGAFTGILLTWDKASYGNHAYTEIWRSQANALGGATLISTTNAFVYADEVGYGATYYYWVRFVSIADVVSPYNATEGVAATTAVDVGAVMQSLSEELSALPGFSTLNTTIPITLGSTTANLQTTIATVNSAAAAAQASVNSLSTSTPRVIRSTSAPTSRDDSSSLQAGDIWMDTDNGNEIFVYTGSTWAASTAGSTSSSDTTLQTQITANGNAISQNASDLLLVAGVSDNGDISTSINITSLNSSITNANNNISGNASAIGALTTRVTSAEGTITAHTGDITELESTLSGYSGTSTVATAVSGLNTRLTSAEGTITNQTSSITSLNSALNGYSGTNGVANAVSGLQTQITSNDNDIATKASTSSVTALTSTVNAKNQTFVQDNAPTAVAVNDLWVDSNDGNKLYRWNGSAWVTIQDGSIGTAIANAATAQSTADGKIDSFYQNDAPGSASEGDIWFDTNDGNKVYTRRSGSWVATQDSGIAAALQDAADADAKADGKVTTFVGTSAPAATAIGDLWIDTDDNNKLYRATAVGSSNWVAVNDTSGIAIHSQDDQPTGVNAGDLWFDTNDNNKQYRYNGSAWVAVDDTRLTSNATAISSLSTAVGLSGSSSTKITNLETTVNNGTTGVGAINTAVGLLTSRVEDNEDDIVATNSSITSLSGTVNTKTQTFVGTSAPTAISVGDLWIDTDDNNKLYRATAAGNSNWVAVNDTSGITVHAQTSQPTGSQEGDLWFDTDDDNKQYRWSGSAWVAVVDTRVAANATAVSNLSTAVGLSGSTSTKITALESTVNHGTTGVAATASAVNQLETTVTAIPVNFSQANAPTTGLTTGDLWVDTDDKQLYRYDGSNWQSIRDSLTSSHATLISQLRTDVNGNAADITTNETAISDESTARATAINQVNASIATKNKTFIGTSAPNALAAGDLWIDSDDANKLYRATGTGSNNWVAVRDTANDNHPRVFTQNDPPTAINTGDIWFDTNDSNKQYRWSGSAWVEVRDVTTNASVTTLSNAVTDIEGNAAASYVLQVNANGAVAGMVIEANASDSGTGTAVQFQADKFAIWDGSGASSTNSVAPFIVDSGVVYIDTARIKDGTITNAKVGTLSADKITTGGMNAARITAGTIDAARIDAQFIKSTDLSTNTSTVIHGGNITTGNIAAQFLDANLIVSSDLGSGGSTTIDGSRITTGQIDANRINVTDLVLPTINRVVSGTTIGGFANNVMRLAQVGEVGTERGIYMGYVRVFGGTGQVKSLSIAIGDGTYSASGSGTQMSGAGNAYDNHPSTGTLPMADEGGLQYHSNRAEFWAGIARFQNTTAIAQIPVTFIKRSGTSAPTNVYVHAQGDGGTRYLTKVEYAFQRLALNQPSQFTFNNQSSVAQSTVFTSNTITLSGNGFSGGTAVLTGDSTAKMSINSGTYVTGSATVQSGDTISLRVTSASSAGVARTATLTITDITDDFRVTTTSSGGGGGGGGGGPS